MSAELIAFLRARLDEDEAAARAAHAPNWSTDGRRGVYYGVEDGWMTDALTTADADHIARHDPARVLREVDAKRALIDDLLAETHAVVEDCWYTCAAVTEERDGGETCRDDMRGEPCECGRDDRLRRHLRLLALSHADHADYQERWRP